MKMPKTKKTKVGVVRLNELALEKRGGLLPNLKNVRRPALILACLVILGVALYYFKSVFIAATVDSRPIWRLSLIKELESQGGQTVLANLIDMSLIDAEAKKANVKIGQDLIDGEIKKIEDQLKAQGTTLGDALAARGQTKASLEDQIKLQKTIESLLSSKINVTEEEMQKYFNDNKSYFPTGSKYEDVKDQIKSQLTSDKLSTEYNTWIADLRSKAKINYFLKF
jgi:hypothetical protein